MTNPVIIVHGGAGDWPRKRHRVALEGVGNAAGVGFGVLDNGGSALDAVEKAVISLENNPIFNAGTGSTLNLDGNIENDAAIMDGGTLLGGGVALLKGVKNPVRLARLIMERTDHVLIAGSGAIRLARALSLPQARPQVPRRFEVWRREVRKFRGGRLRDHPRNYSLVRSGILSKVGDTVGALALDKQGFLAAACSTGGMSLKLPGRIGDSAILGAGLYADNSTGAATATGIGELAIRAAISKTACDLMRTLSATAASTSAMRTVGKRFGKGLGIITLSKTGKHGVTHNTRNLCWAVKDRKGSNAGITGKRM